MDSALLVFFSAHPRFPSPPSSSGPSMPSPKTPPWPCNQSKNQGWPSYPSLQMQWLPPGYHMVLAWLTWPGSRTPPPLCKKLCKKLVVKMVDQSQGCLMLFPNLCKKLVVEMIDQMRRRRLLLPPTLPRVPPPQVAVDDPLLFDKEFGKTSILAPMITAHPSSSFFPHLLLDAAGGLGALWSPRSCRWPAASTRP